MGFRRIARIAAALGLAAALGWAFTEGGRVRIEYWALIIRIVTTANFDEEEVPEYRLPDPLVSQAGEPVRTVEEWRVRRGQILDFFRSEVYGASPDVGDPVRVLGAASRGAALGGSALRQQWRLAIDGEADGRVVDLLLYTPASATGPVPVFLGLNFRGNHTVHADPGVRLSDSWMPDDPETGVEDHRATEAGRGRRSSRWPLELILDRGYGLATLYSGDIAPDRDDAGVKEALAAWAFGLRRSLDHLVAIPEVDANRVAVFGHSRLGKTALWAGAQDERFAMVISNDSGCLGAALSRRRFGESVALITDLFPHWFAPGLSKYANNEDAMPVDQHMLLALIAPRPLYVASATEDRWADPKGEFLSIVAAGPVYELHGEQRLRGSEVPAIDAPVVAGALGYHVRSGGHDITEWDWGRYLDFADAHLAAASRRPRPK